MDACACTCIILASEMRLVIGILESSERECTFGSCGSSGRRRGQLSAIHHNISPQYSCVFFPKRSAKADGDGGDLS
jgi:hypothetical protein